MEHLQHGNHVLRLYQSQLEIKQTSVKLKWDTKNVIYLASSRPHANFAVVIHFY